MLSSSPPQNTTSSSLRPTFFLHDKEDFPIRAAGIIPYTFINNRPYALLLEKKGVFEDFGGKTESSDTSYITTAIRECYEESNYILKFTTKDINIQASWYSKSSKYITFYVRIDSTISLESFGDHEKNTLKKQNIQWIDLSLWNKINLHPRLRNNKFIYTLLSSSSSSLSLQKESYIFNQFSTQGKDCNNINIFC